MACTHIRSLRRAAAARLSVCGLFRVSPISCTTHTRAAHAAAAGEHLILGIESSCDDTGVAVVSSSGRILGEALATQEEVHKRWGGVVPSLAQEAHAEAIDDVVDQAMQSAGITYSNLDAVAYTIGPGLSLCLRVGAGKARQLAHSHNLPLVPCHHMEAHALVARLNNKVEFPFVCLLISGGHNLLLVVRGVGDYMQLGTALDDSIGESFDKVARMLGLDAMPSGGPALEAFAKHGDPTAVPLTLPMQAKKTCDFSYSGLKTSVLIALQERCPPADADSGGGSGEPDTSPATASVRADIAASFQRVAVEQLAQRTARGLTWAKEVAPEVRTLVVSGGVAANQSVRARLDEVAAEADLAAVYPESRLCTDNGVMVAWAGVERLGLGLADAPPSAEEAADKWVEVHARWPLTAEKHPRCAVPARRSPLRAPRKPSRIPCEPLTDMTRSALAAAEGHSTPAGGNGLPLGV
eukprot:jgi/Ulvmu1/9168/UM005_0266.1